MHGRIQPRWTLCDRAFRTLRVTARTYVWVVVAWMTAVSVARAHTGVHPSVHDTVAGILQRFREAVAAGDRTALTRARAERRLTDGEKEVLGHGHITFRVNVPVRVTVFHDRALSRDPFWLRDGTWRREAGIVEVAEVRFDRWHRDFPAGEVGLGVNSIGGGGRHYFAAIRPLVDEALEIDDLYPGQLGLTNLVAGAQPWADREDAFKTVPEGFEGQILLQTLHAKRDDGRLLGRVLRTQHPASERPDHIVLTWSGDPQTTQAIQWRTSTRVPGGAVRFVESARSGEPASAWRRVEARTTTLTSVSTANDPVVHRHTAEIAGLTPETTYAYQVGDGSDSGWGELGEFTTAPPRPEPFAFVYMGDAQNGLDTWGRLVRGAYRARPDVAFYLMAGDLVNRGNDRDDWDEFFENARGVFDRRTLVPVLGNHECQGGRPTLYLEQFALPHNGPTGVDPERAYAFAYGNALFVVLDSNLAPETQTAWLEDQLRSSTARWKIVTCHHPTYSSAPNRDNKRMREAWSPVFDRYGVDLALQGHDHAYLRTHPIRGGERAPSAAEGTTYVVSVSGTKMYRQADRPETAMGFTDVATWQVLDLEIDGDRLTYRAYDRRGRIRDAFVIDKSGSAAAP